MTRLGKLAAIVGLVCVLGVAYAVACLVLSKRLAEQFYLDQLENHARSVLFYNRILSDTSLGSAEKLRKLNSLNAADLQEAALSISNGFAAYQRQIPDVWRELQERQTGASHHIGQNE